MRRLSLALLMLVMGCQGYPDEAPGNFDFRQHALPFRNFTSDTGGLMTPALAARMFGADVACSSGDGATCVPTPQARAWIDDANLLLKSGHSEGMAVLSALISLGKVDPTTLGAASGAELDGNDPRVQAEVTYWSVTQRLPTVHAQDRKFAAKEVMPFLSKILDPNSRERWRLLIAVRGPTGYSAGHAVIPFGYFKGEKDGQFVLRVYDSNEPAVEQRLLLDTNANTWSYAGCGSCPGQAAYEGTPQNGNLLHFSPVTPRLAAPFPAPWAADAPLTVSTSGLSVSVQADTGARVGFDGEKLVESGGFVLPGSAAGCTQPHQVMSTTLMGTSTGSQTVTVDNLGTSREGGTLNVTGSNFSATVEGVKADATTGARDTMTVSNNGQTVQYSSGSDGALTITVNTTTPDGKKVSTTVTVSGKSDSVTVDTSKAPDVVVSVSGAPAGTTVTSTTTVTSGTSTTTNTTMATTQGADAKVTYNTSTNTSSTSAAAPPEPCTNGVKDSLEADVDCGAQCVARLGSTSAKCALDKACSVAADCASGLCFRGVCSTGNCKDGLKNGPETDVDCGSGESNCPKCVTGQACTSNASCTNNVCASGLCAGKTRHELEVHGLPEGQTFSVSGTIDGQYANVIFTGRVESPIIIPFEALNSYRLNSYAGTQFKCDFPGGSVSWSRPDAGTPVTTRRRLDCLRTGGSLWVHNHNTGCRIPETWNRRGAYLDIVTYLYGPGYVMPYDNPNPSPRRQSLGYLSANADGGPTWEFRGTRPRNLDIESGPARETCTYSGPATGTWDSKGEATLDLACVCTSPDGGVLTWDADGGLLVNADAGPGGAADAGVDAGTGGPTDAGVDAGTDAGSGGGVDAGAPFDAGAAVDAGHDAGQPGCSTDSQCASGNCYCGENSGNCGGSGTCGKAPTVISAPTADGVAASGTFTVPTGCSQVFVAAWGAAGGGAESMMIPFSGGGGGYVSGALSATAGDVFTVWIGAGGAKASVAAGTEGKGSYAGTPANGGLGDGQFGGDTGGGGGGLTSVKQTGSVTRVFSVPGGAGAGPQRLAEPGGGAGAGSASTRGGGDAAFGSTSGGGGAGDPGGNAGVNGAPGDPGAFGTLPTGMTSQPGSVSNGYGASLPNYLLCPTNTAQGNVGGAGNGCVVFRCVAP